MLSPNMQQWIAARIVEAKAILASPRSTPSQRTVAKYVLAQWSE
jgi:hypothetical protein